jgi:hypothetical protein
VTRRRSALFCATALWAAAALTVLGGAHPAGAAAPDQQGWWTTANQGSIPEVGQPAPAPSPPDVPAKGLLVEGPSGSAVGGATSSTPVGGTSSAPLAYAGLVYYLPIGATASTLTLSVTKNSASTPMATLELCPLVNPVLNPEEGGPSTDAPPYDCTHNVSAGPNTGGTAYQFQVSNLVADGSLGVAILPTSPTDRVVLDQPDANSLTEQAAPAGSVPQVPTFSSGTTPISSLGTPVPGALPTFGISPYAAPSGSAPAVGGTAAPAAPAPAAPAPATPSRSTSAIPVLGSLAGDTASPLTVALVMAGLMGGAALWFMAGRRRAGEGEGAELAEVTVGD